MVVLHINPFLDKYVLLSHRYKQVIANGRTTVPKTTHRRKFKHKAKDKPF